ncbi:glycosyltransferase family protein [Radicibacter daui]|uniref:glycosyltransferase family protein n=1 Tax=Radicibacter daui TaxID=3064829 RepID=UPI0040470477
MPAAPRNHHRILMYSHDSFGLGHLRRCREIAHSLVDTHRDLSVLIISGSPIIGSYDFKSRVDFVRIPGVIKLRNGEYTSLKLHIDTRETLRMRREIIRHTAQIFDPDMLIVDKEPLGLRGEIKSTLSMLKRRGCRLVLGIRDVMDDPDLLEPEWERKEVMPVLRDLYDDIWVYGTRSFYEPLTGLDVPEDVVRKMRYTGYLRRQLPAVMSPTTIQRPDEPYLLVTPGGGGDGIELIDWVISAYEFDRSVDFRSLIVLGPFMPSHAQADFMERAARIPALDIITFDSYPEALIEGCRGMIAMGGYNTFCEILSFDKPAVIVPRTTPRKEQYIRARRAQELGMLRMLEDDGLRHPQAMVTALKTLFREGKPPSAAGIPGLLAGLENINNFVGNCLMEHAA